MQIKTGDVRVLANTAFLLVKKDWSSEIRLHAFKMLQVCAHVALLFLLFFICLVSILMLGSMIRNLESITLSYLFFPNTSSYYFIGPVGLLEMKFGYDQVAFCCLLSLELSFFDSHLLLAIKYLK